MKFFLLLILTCAGGQLAAQKAELEQIARMANIPGMQLAYTKDGRTQLYSIGVTNNFTKQSVTNETLFQAASLTKPVVAYLVMQLAERGVINLDTPLSHYYKYARLTEPDAQLITARMVLNHTTGLPNWGPQDLKLRNKPGTKWGYSGEGFQFLRKVIEERTGKSMETLIEDQVFKPLRMRNSRLVWSDAIAKKVARGHNQFGDTISVWKPNEMNAASSLFTTARDYALFLQALMQGRNLRPVSAAQMVTASSLADAWAPKEVQPYVKWGLGVGLEENRHGKALWHWGDNFSFRCFFMAFPASKESLVYFTNSENGLRITDKLLKLFFGEENTYWSTQWNSYGAYDDSAFQTRLKLGRAWLMNGTTDGTRVYNELYRSNPKYFEGNDVINGVAGALISKKDYANAETLLRLQLNNVPLHAFSLQRMGELETFKGNYEGSIAFFEKAKVDTSRIGALNTRIEFSNSALKSKMPAKAIELSKYAGRYTEVMISVRDGKLVAKGDDGVETTMVPLSFTDFETEPRSNFRVLFVLGKDGVPEQLILYFLNGDKRSLKRG